MQVREFFPVEIVVSLAVAYAVVLGLAVLVALAVDRLKMWLGAAKHEQPSEDRMTTPVR